MSREERRRRFRGRSDWEQLRVAVASIPLDGFPCVDPFCEGKLVPAGPGFECAICYDQIGSFGEWQTKMYLDGAPAWFDENEEEYL